MTLKLIDVIQMLDGRIAGGADYEWNSFPNGHVLEFNDAYGKPFATCIFSKTTYNVYELTVCREHDAFRWIDPIYFDANAAECSYLGFDHDNAWDNVKWQDTDYLHLAVLIKDINERKQHEQP